MVASIAAIISGVSFAPLSAGTDPITQNGILGALNSQRSVIVPGGVRTDSLPPGDEFYSLKGEAVGGNNRTDNHKGSGLIVFFSSGTTGVPKGVVSTWERVLARAKERHNMLRGKPGPDTLLTFSPLNFSFGFGHLLQVFVGSTVYFADLQSTSLTDIIRSAEEHKVTRSHLTPSTAKLLGHHVRAARARLSTLNTIEVTGEALRWEDLRDIRHLGRPDTRVLLGISATESALYFWCDFEACDLPEMGLAPLGHPAKGDVQFVPPPGVNDDHISEVLTSRLLAEGYWANDELEAERFVTDASGKRWWKSGDLVTQGDDGLYYHAGRVDDMVKIRGHQVHLAQVEGQLIGLEGVGQAVVLVSPDNFLEAHIVPIADTPLDPKDIRRQIESLLPTQTHPRSITIHKQFPLTERGKINRAVLRQGANIGEVRS
jgi:acyl-coenzyme A synthetase/AMP-(fatty) acid ligase